LKKHIIEQPAIQATKLKHPPFEGEQLNERSSVLEEATPQYPWNLFNIEVQESQRQLGIQRTFQKSRQQQVRQPSLGQPEQQQARHPISTNNSRNL